jgi:6-pyruvoyl-tetrahydropterin synthase
VSERVTGVRGRFCAAHYSPEGALHGHSYLVSVAFAEAEDARPLKLQLDRVLSTLDHCELPRMLSRAEDLAEHIALACPGAIEVVVDRPLDDFFGRWHA